MNKHINKILILLIISNLSGCASANKDPIPPCACFNPQPINKSIEV